MICHMGQGPYGPEPIWAKAQGPLDPGPLGPGPFLVGRTPHQKTQPGKKSPNVVFVYFLEAKKMRDVRMIILAAVSCRDLCYVSENKGFRFAKNKLIHAESSFIARRSRAHFCFMKFIPINVLIPYINKIFWELLTHTIISLGSDHIPARNLPACLLTERRHPPAAQVGLEPRIIQL